MTTSLPTVTAADLLTKLLEEGAVTKLSLISLLGVDRHNFTLNVLEMAVLRENLVSETRLAQMKSEISGRPALTDPRIDATDFLDRSVAAAHGALVLDREPLTVAMVEDTPENVQAVADALKTNDFEIWFTTSPDFARLMKEAYSARDKETRSDPSSLFEVLDYGISQGASDIHIAVGIPPRLRVDGIVVDTPFRSLSREWVSEQVVMLADERHIKDLETKDSADLAYTFGSARFRVNIAKDTSGNTFSLRKLPTAIPDFDEIALPQILRSLSNLERGMVLVTGPTGSGKSTTLASIINDIILHSKRHVITLEDPIEFRFPKDKKSVVNQRELGQSFPSFAEGLRDALRQDPDVILVGEMRDAETIRTAITAAETGHLVFGTLHTYDAASTIMRVVNSFPANEQDAVRSQLATLLRAIVSQTLVPRAGGKGRVAAHEILIATTAIVANLRKPDGHSQIKQTMQTSFSEGMITMEASLAKLVISGQIPRHEGEFRSRDVAEFNKMHAYYSTQATKLRTAEQG